ncbi:hypothetical protein GJB61_10400 [Paenibacillus sp. LC-T2]|uniref:Ubiquitin-conjugating enzyme C-terminal fungi domain-containing protein n=1 Tax=Paenibacillus monticola TaxID=2666075 RepID=A0A7X2H4K8_9BACL|nr:hypothetical protein [Paenibacillus monticola]
MLYAGLNKWGFESRRVITCLKKLEIRKLRKTLKITKP